MRLSATKGCVMRNDEPPTPPPSPPLPSSPRLKLRTVVSIAPEGPMDDEAMFCREHAARLVTVRAELYREEAVTVTVQQVTQVSKGCTNGIFGWL